MASLFSGPDAVYASCAALLAAVCAWFAARAVCRREFWPATVAWVVAGTAGGASVVMLARACLGDYGWAASWAWAAVGAIAGFAAAVAGTWLGRRAGGPSPVGWFVFGAVAGFALAVVVEYPAAAEHVEERLSRPWHVPLWVCIVPFVGAMAGGWLAIWGAGAIARVRRKRFADAPPPRGNWRQFSLRSLFEFVLAVAVAMSMFTFDREHRGALALEELEAQMVAIRGSYHTTYSALCGESTLCEIYSTGKTAQAVAMLNRYLENGDPFQRAMAWLLIVRLAPDARIGSGG